MTTADIPSPNASGNTVSAGVFVYVIADQNQAVKIGVAKNVQNRLRGLQTGHSRRLSLEHAISCDSRPMAYAVESLAHTLLRHSLLEGEWFSATAQEALEAVEAAIVEFRRNPDMPRIGRRESKINTILRRVIPLTDWDINFLGEIAWHAIGNGKPIGWGIETHFERRSVAGSVPDDFLTGSLERLRRFPVFLSEGNDQYFFNAITTFSPIRGGNLTVIVSGRLTEMHSRHGKQRLLSVVRNQVDRVVALRQGIAA